MLCLTDCAEAQTNASCLAPQLHNVCEESVKAVYCKLPDGGHAGAMVAIMCALLLTLLLALVLASLLASLRLACWGLVCNCIN